MINKQKIITSKNKLNLNIKGEPDLSFKKIESSGYYNALPSLVPFIKPKALFKEGDRVSLGDNLFFDKRNPKCVFVSPFDGVVDAIEYGPRRRLDVIRLKIDASKPNDAKSISINKDNIAQLLQEKGLWPSLRAFPFRNIPKLDERPPQILVSLDNLEPFYPKSSCLIDQEADAFEAGLAALKYLAPVRLIVLKDNKEAIQRFRKESIILIDNQYPLSDPGIALYKTKKTVEENKSWYIQPQHVIEIGYLLQTGRLKQSRIISIAGPASDHAAHYSVALGEDFNNLLIKSENNQDINNKRVVSGGLLSGRNAEALPYLGYDDSALNLISSAYEPELLSFLQLGAKKISYSKTFLSSFLKLKESSPDVHLNGGYRDCVSCGFCSEVNPVDFSPQAMMKEIKSGNIEEAMKLGLLDFVPTGVCSYVCPSKIDLDMMFEDAKQSLYKELES